MFGMVPFDKKRNQMQAREPGLLDLDSVFENFFNDSVFPSFNRSSGLMKVDIQENEENYMLEADLPGVEKDQVHVSLDDDILTIEVDYDEQDEKKDKNYVRRERRCGSMTRSFNINNVDPDKIEAKMKNGVLSLTLPKKEPDKNRRRSIDIK